MYDHGFLRDMEHAVFAEKAESDKVVLIGVHERVTRR